MADKSRQLVLAALSRAVADPDGLPLHGGKSLPGLFPATSGGKQAARRCLDEGYLRPVDATEPKPRCAVTDKGLAFLLAQASPRQVLEDFVRTLEAREAQFDDLLVKARAARASLETMRSNAETILNLILRNERPGSLASLFNTFRNEPADAVQPTTEDAILAHLAARQSAEDCPLPELYRRCAADDADLTVGRFHDALRQLRADERVYLHPWTGPLYDLPEPACALLVGHEVVYYASQRNAEVRMQQSA